MDSASKFFALICRFGRSRSGNVAMIAAIMLPVLIGFCGYGSDVGYWYYRQRVVQAAADIAAFNATVALRAGETSYQVDNTADTSATKNGWKSSIGTITVNTPPTSGTHQNQYSVEVLLKENEPRYFTALFSKGTVPENARAVATYTIKSNACMLALNKNAAGAMTFWGNNNADFTDCNAVSNSLASNSVNVGGSGAVTAPCMNAAGDAYVHATLTLTDCNQIATGVAQTDDPYATLPPPPIPASCSTPPSGNGTQTIDPGKYCGGLTLHGDITVEPGIYVIDGGTFQINANSFVHGSDVMFYLTDGATLQFNGTADVQLTAMTTGTYAGVLIYGDRTQANATNTLNGTADSVLTGAIYFPSQEVQFLGDYSGANGCLQVVADTIYYTGSGSFHSDCTGTGMANIQVASAVTLVE